MGQEDRAAKKVGGGNKGGGSAGWDRDRMTETHRKGKRKAKSVAASARRNFSKAVVKGALESLPPPPKKLKANTLGSLMQSQGWPAFFVVKLVEDWITNTKNLGLIQYLRRVAEEENEAKDDG